MRTKTACQVRRSHLLVDTINAGVVARTLAILLTVVALPVLATPIDWQTSATFVSGPTVTGPTGTGVAGGGQLDILRLSTGAPIINTDAILEDLTNGFRATDVVFRYHVSIGDQTYVENSPHTFGLLTLTWQARRGFHHPPGLARNTSALDVSISVIQDPLDDGIGVIYASLHTRHLYEPILSDARVFVLPLGFDDLGSGASATFTDVETKLFDHETPDLDVLVQDFEFQFTVATAGQVVDIVLPQSADSLTSIEHTPLPGSLALMAAALMPWRRYWPSTKTPRHYEQ